MGLKSILKTIAPVAPLLTKLLPLPGAGVASELLATALGVENEPAKIEAALASDPQALAKIKEVELNNQAELQRLVTVAETNRLLAVNETMQSEGKSEHWPQWAWRPFWGFVSGVAFLILTGFICFLMWKAISAGDVAAINAIPQMITSFSTLFAIPLAILGVASWHRGKEKRLLAGETSNGDIVTRLLGKKAA